MFCIITLLSFGALGRDDYLSINSKVREHLESSFFNATFALANSDKIFNCGASGIASLDGRQLRFNQVMPTSGFLDVLLATSVLLLEQRGDLKLYNPIKVYFNKSDREEIQAMPPWVLDFSISDLLLHNTGLSELEDVTLEQIKNPSSLFTSPPKSKRYVFSQRNNVLLMLLIEEVSGKTFNEFCFDNILRPLELENTNFLNGEEVVRFMHNKDKPGGEYPIRYYVTDFHKRKASFTPVKLHEVLKSNYQGFVTSTVTDMINFYRGIEALKVLNKQQYKKMLRGQFVIDESTNLYKTYGAFAHVVNGKLKAIYNSRVTPGQTDFVGYVVDNRLYCSVISNASALQSDMQNNIVMNFIQNVTKD
ncbi:serine hydrolase [Candidatus Sarmatiella mevalonica]|uniref:serine hydrolase n=1 Tax=Candidatus Sarmatiella mevalonica TaxID=2770581 RepID=UPI001922934D|nr:serine hydrolase domain-containing protein [Candidatus Sarmatiella mevalonica]